MIKAVAVDDETFALKVIENFCADIEGITLLKTFSNATDGLKYLNKFPVDLVFLDIDMPSLNGIELFKKMKQSTLVIFITSRADYAIEGFNLRAMDYLLKPFSFERFQESVKRAQEYLNLTSQTEQTVDSHYLFIRADFSLIKIPIADIIYIEALDDYLKIYIQDQKTLVARMTMKAILEKLPASKFVRTHRSFIVATERIKALRAKFVLVDRLEIPVGRNYLEEVEKKFTK